MSARVKKKRVTHWRIFDEFMQGLSCTGLARKYGKPKSKIQEIIREMGRRPWRTI